MNTLYLHVGAAKTGTTAIQYYFSKHPTAGSLEYLPIARQYQGHHGIASALMGDQRFDWLEPYDLKQLAEEIRHLEVESKARYFASSEAFASIDFIELGGLWKLKELFNNWNVQIIYYIRNQCALVESTFLQVAKTGAFLGNLDEWYSEFKTKGIGGFATMARSFQETFESDNVHLISFDEWKGELMSPLEKITSAQFDNSKIKKENKSSILVSLLLQSVAKDTGSRLIGPLGARLRTVAGNILGQQPNRTLVPREMRDQITREFREENTRLLALSGIDLQRFNEISPKEFLDPSEINIEVAKSKLIIELAKLKGGIALGAPEGLDSRDGKALELRV